MDVEESVQMLLTMGFPSESEVRRALKMAKDNDINEAVELLTTGQTSGYDDVTPVPDSHDAAMAVDNADDAFPATNLYELEGRVLTSQWSIPYREDESLAKCMFAAIQLFEVNQAWQNEVCSQFLNKSFLESFNKLLDSQPIHRWNSEIQEGVYDMVKIMIQLVAAALTPSWKGEDTYVPARILEVLALSFSSTCEFHKKNRSMRKNVEHWDERLGEEKMISIPHKSSLGTKEHFWLSNIINMFMSYNGFDMLADIITYPKTSIQDMAALTEPMANAAEVMIPRVARPILERPIKKVLQVIQNLGPDDFRDKMVGRACDLLRNVKIICDSLWPSEAAVTDDKRLDLVLRMLKCTHFNAKMNALIEISKMIEDSACMESRVRGAIPLDTLTQWMSDNEVLTIILSGSIDQAQYCEKVKKIVLHAGPHLSKQDLDRLWNTAGHALNVVDNIHGIFAVAASHFSLTQFAHFSALILNNWTEENEEMKGKLVVLLGGIGIDTRNQDLAVKILEVLWELSHRPDLSRHLVDQCQSQMYKVLVESQCIKESVKRRHIEKCVDNIKKGQWILPAITQLVDFTKHVVKSAHKADKVKYFQELHKSNDSQANKLLVSSLLQCHQRNVKAAAEQKCKLSPELLIDNNYTHQEYIKLHLECLQLVIQDGCLLWNRVKELWECLINNPDAVSWEQGYFFDWLSKLISEIDTDAVTNLFTKKLMQLNPLHLTESGLSCWKTFFNQVNLQEGKLKKSISLSSSVSVEKTELIGLDILWSFCLNVLDREIADQAIRFLLENIYINLSPKFKRDIAGIHRQFIEECHERLEALMISMRAKGSVVYTSLSQALYHLTAVAVPGLEQLPAPLKPKYTLNIERLLLIVEKYVMTVEEAFQGQRAVLPHGVSFYGAPLTLQCECESRRENFHLKTHRNATLLHLKSRIAESLKVSQEQLIFINHKLNSSKDQRLLCQLGLVNQQKVSFRISHSGSSASSSANPVYGPSPASSRTSAASSAAASAASPGKLGLWENEKNLPGVLMAEEGQVFKLLYQLANLDEPRITERLDSLLHLIPTDPSILSSVSSAESVDSLPGSRSTSRSTSPTSSLKRHPTQSPSSSLKRQISRQGSVASLASTRSEASRLCHLLFTYQQSALGDREISPFRLKYNLEVLSACIMPLDGPSTHFTDDFLQNNGVHLLTQIFREEFFNADVNKNLRQTCYLISLQILHQLLCDSSTILSQMDTAQLTDLINSMIRVSWAASVGKLHLVTPPMKSSGEQTAGRIRLNSSESNTSSSSDTDNPLLQAGVCILHSDLSDINTSISVQAFQVLTQCVCERPDIIGMFYALPHISEFLIDMLTGCCRDEVRSNCVDCLQRLAELAPPADCPELPKHFLLKVVMAARLPYWISNSSTRGCRQRLLLQCLQYFDLRCALLTNVTLDEQRKLNLNVSRMIEDEMAWLSNFQPADSVSAQLTINDILLTGHLRLVGGLLTAENVQPSDHTPLITTLLEEFLFPATKLQRSSEVIHSCLADFSPKCRVTLSQDAAYSVLLTLCSDCSANYRVLADTLVMWHHSTVDTSEWEYLPAVEARNPAGYVGLKNGGATCYMNSVLQQMYMIPGVPELLLSVSEEDGEEEVSEQRLVFREVQQVFGHLLDSQLQYFEPEQLWHVFKLWGQSVNVREQQDAYDFFTALTDQLDETLKQLGNPALFEQRLKGMFSDQKICEGCPHKYEREEPFLALNLTVSDQSLERSLHQFVKGERLEGDNSYFCEKCNVKRSAIKRMCIKSLPPVLCIHLKRFSYDWDQNKALKFDDYFKFPMVLDMSPYMLDEPEPQTYGYELVGIVVHTGQASAGHYYSYIKERRGSTLTNANYGKWFKFNDTSIDEFELTEQSLMAECFGGKYKANLSESGNTNLPEDRVRYWNAYLLFYERIPGSTRPATNRRSSRLQKIRRSTSGSPAARTDSLVELSDLVQQSECQGTFNSAMSVSVQRAVRNDNLQFLRNRNLYSTEYFSFVRRLVTECQLSDIEPAHQMDLRINLASKFILNTYLHTKETLRKDLNSWFEWFKLAYNEQPEISHKVLQICSSDPHQYLVPYLLACPIRGVREFFFNLLKQACSELANHRLESMQDLSPLDDLLEALLTLLGREVIDHSRNAHEYFLFLDQYSRMHSLTCDQLMSHDALVLFVQFLVGTLPTDATIASTPRRFNILHTRELGPLHAAVSILILHLRLPTENGECELTPLEYPPEPLLDPTEHVSHIFSPGYAPFFIREALVAVKELEGSQIDVIIDALVYLSHSLSVFSDLLMTQLSVQMSITPGNELRGLIKLAAQLLMLADDYQSERLVRLIDDTQYGALHLIKESHIPESLKSYQLIKLLTDTSSKSPVVATHLQGCTQSWQWCVDWLKRKMNENSWTSLSSTSNQETPNRTFLRTVSAQAILQQATAMLPVRSRGSSSDMDIDQAGSMNQLDETSIVPDQDESPPDTEIH